MCGFLDNWKLKRTERAKRMYEDAKDTMAAFDAPYVLAKGFISEYEKAIKLGSGSSLKYARKALTAAIDESRASRIHSEATDMLGPQRMLEDKVVVNLESKYRSCMASGKLKSGKKVAEKMLSVANSGPDDCPIDVRMDFNDLGDGVAHVIVINKGTTPIIVDSVYCTSGSERLKLESSMSEALQPSASLKRQIAIDPGTSQNVSVQVDYEIGMDARQVRRHFPVTRGV